VTIRAPRALWIPVVALVLGTGCGQEDPDPSIFEVPDGVLRIVTVDDTGAEIPGATILIEGSISSATGEEYGTTPASVSLQPGDYDVQVCIEGYTSSPLDATITVLGTRTADAEFVLTSGEAVPGRVQVQAFTETPGGTPEEVTGMPIFVDGVEQKDAVTPATLELECGNHTITLGDSLGFLPGPDAAIDVRAVPGEIATTRFTLTPGYLQRVMVEDITNSGCIPCPPAEERLLHVLEGYDRDRVFSVHVHSRTPGVGDPMYWANSTELQARWAFYELGGNPFFFVNGVILSGTSEEEVADSVDAVLPRVSPVHLEAGYDVAGDSVHVDVRVRALTDVPGDWRLLVMSLQNVIDYGTAPGDNGQAVFIRTVRDYIPSHPGDPISLTAGMDETRSYSAQLLQAEHPFANPADDPDEVSVVAILQDATTRDVIQVTATGIIE